MMEMYFEKVVNGLLKVILDQWNRLGTNHCLTVVLFARTVYLKPGKKDVSPLSTGSGTPSVFQRKRRDSLQKELLRQSLLKIMCSSLITEIVFIRTLQGGVGFSRDKERFEA
jgi:hypothetical protein